MGSVLIASILVSLGEEAYRHSHRDPYIEPTSTKHSCRYKESGSLLVTSCDGAKL